MKSSNKLNSRQKYASCEKEAVKDERNGNGWQYERRWKQSGRERIPKRAKVSERGKKSDKRKRSKNKIKVGGKMNPSDLISCDWNDVMNFSM